MRLTEPKVRCVFCVAVTNTCDSDLFGLLLYTVRVDGRLHLFSHRHLGFVLRFVGLSHQPLVLCHHLCGFGICGTDSGLFLGIARRQERVPIHRVAIPNHIVNGLLEGLVPLLTRHSLFRKQL